MEAAIDRLEAAISKWENYCRNVKTLSYQYLTILKLLAVLLRLMIRCLGDFDYLISTHQLELDQSQTLEKLESFHFN